MSVIGTSHRNSSGGGGSILILAVIAVLGLSVGFLALSRVVAPAPAPQEVELPTLQLPEKLMGEGGNLSAPLGQEFETKPDITFLETNLAGTIACELTL